jgi:hypothetical protein
VCKGRLADQYRYSQRQPGNQFRFHNTYLKLIRDPGGIRTPPKGKA